MHTHFICRHYVDGKETLEELASRISLFYTVPQLSRKHGDQFSFGLKLTLDPHTSDEVRYGVKQLLFFLPSDCWLLYDTAARRPGTSLSQVLFNPMFYTPPSIVVNADLDQFVLDTADGFGTAYELVRKVFVDNALLGIGARDVPVVLARDPFNSRLRIIHELFQSLALGPEKVRASEQRENITPAYAAFGDHGSGFYVMNTFHPMYPDLLRSVAHASRVSHIHEIPMDFYIVAKAIQYEAPIVASYVRARENKFYKPLSKNEEFAWVHRFVTHHTQELTKTDVAPMLLEVIKGSRRNYVDDLVAYYSRDLVNEVRCWMYDALTRVQKF
ncbi:MAG TPA: hypothetical protein VJJ79_03100 [Candidatus Nanoarchaeia archaeon]|nr:hypothetical protein [Candidatus Nanoarchaeia archaeon]